jgi:hypothetical protein
MEHKPDIRQLHCARDRFRELLSREGSPESEFQDLFTSCPFILSETLPLKLRSVDIVPQAKPGARGADFLIYPRPIPFIYGAIEIKRPDTPILSIPRRDTLILSRDAATALAQARKSASLLKTRIEGSLPLCAIGDSAHLFLIVGLATELNRKINTNHLRQQLDSLLPPNSKLVPYDTLLGMFEREVPPIVYFLTPATEWLRPQSPEREVAVRCCIDYVRKHPPRPDSPDSFEIAQALREAGLITDFSEVLDLLSQLVADGVLGETDSLYPPFETLFYLR